MPAGDLGDVDQEVISVEPVETPALRPTVGARADDGKATVRQAA
jgi:hypothetical protein